MGQNNSKATAATTATATAARVNARQISGGSSSKKEVGSPLIITDDTEKDTLGFLLDDSQVSDGSSPRTNESSNVPPVPPPHSRRNGRRRSSSSRKKNKKNKKKSVLRLKQNHQKEELVVLATKQMLDPSVDMTETETTKTNHCPASSSTPTTTSTTSTITSSSMKQQKKGASHQYSTQEEKAPTTTTSSSSIGCPAARHLQTTGLATITSQKQLIDTPHRNSATTLMSSMMKTGIKIPAAQPTKATTEKQQQQQQQQQRRTARRPSLFYEKESFHAEANSCIDQLNNGAGGTTSPLCTNKRDQIMVMQIWNKVLAFQTAFEEALSMKWRVLVAKDEIRTTATMDDADVHWTAIDQVESNKDPIALCLGTRLYDTSLCGMIDGTVRAMCPHTQSVAREAYRPLNSDKSSDTNMVHHLECQTVSDYFYLYARCGICPQHWVLFGKAFLWTLRTHAPYLDDVDKEELRNGNNCCLARYVATHISIPAIETSLQLRAQFTTSTYAVSLGRFWGRVSAGDENKALIGETFYRALLTNYPELLNYFAKADMDSLALHLVAALDLCIRSIPKIGEARTTFRGVLEHIGELHRRLGIPTYSYALVGAQLLDSLQPFFEQEEELIKHDDLPVTAGELEKAFATVYGEVMSFTHHPMLRDEKLIAMAEEFFEQVAEELKWSPAVLAKRMLEVQLEIGSSGTYSHTSAELEIGAKLAWRNSSKCVGRISWNTLQVRDCRHVEEPEDIFREVQEHLRIATGGTNIQSVMTIFKPRGKQTWGTRFWSSQFVRYAGYKDEGTGDVLGDPANTELTEYLLKRKLWAPPEPKTGFDILPIVLKQPGERLPYVFELPQDCIHEVEIEHPTCPQIAELGLRWTTVPAISNFNMNLGGVDYQCCPFNGWFVSTEVVRNLLERYNVGEQWADRMGIDTSEDMWKNKVYTEMDTAVLHSFRTSQYTVVDPVSVGKSFCTHVARERESFGRECPAQWSWIGGFLGPTNVTWHMEMRDFIVKGSAYEYASDALLLMDDSHLLDKGNLAARRQSTDSLLSSSLPTQETKSILILYGSETGNAEAVAFRLARSLSLLRPVVKCLNEVAGLGIVEELGITHLLIICSTFGKGEAPQNAEDFFKTDVPPGILTNTHVAMLALGSTLYPDYCRSGVLLDQKLKKAGRKELVPLQKADAATGDEGTIFDWCSLVKRLVLPPHTEKRLKAELAPVHNAPAIEHSICWIGSMDDISAERDPFQWPQSESSMCISNEELIGVDGEDNRSTRRVVFSVPDGAIYETGDHLCVSPLNNLKAVERFARLFANELKEAAQAMFGKNTGESDDTIIHWQMKETFRVDCKEYGRESQIGLSFKTPTTLWDALQAYIDLALHPSTLPDLVTMLNRRLELVLAHTANLEADEIFQRYHDYVFPILMGTSDEKRIATNRMTDQFPTIMDFFEEFSSLFSGTFTPDGSNEHIPVLPLGEVLAVLPRLLPRYYSISSSSRTSPSEVAITVGVLHRLTPNGINVDGVCSNYLSKLRAGVDRARVTVRKSAFRAPADVESPVIMIGTGTGLAPLMGFIEDRSNDLLSVRDSKESNPLECHLFFGCRNEAERIYKAPLEMYDNDGVINCHLALSRESPRQHVQDKLREMGSSLCKLLLDDRTHYYVCGDAKMADECYEVCIETLRKYNDMSRVSAVQHLKRMRAAERWQMDLWGVVHQFQESRDAIAMMKNKSAKIWLSRFVENDYS